MVVNLKLFILDKELLKIPVYKIWNFCLEYEDD